MTEELSKEKTALDPDLAAIEEGVLFVNAGVRAGLALKNGFSMDALGEFVNVIRTGPAFLRDLSLVIPEYKDITPDAKLRLTQFVVANVDLQDATAEEYLTKALLFMIAISDIIKLLLPKAK